MAICPTCLTKFPDTDTTCNHDGALLVPDEAFAHVDKDLAAGDVVGEYRVEKKLGEGGFGAVFAAIHPVIGKHAAIKVLGRQFSANPQMVSRFIAEARAVNQIRHRNIIDIFAFGQLPDGRQYYVMELLEGVTFDRYLASNKRLTLAQALPILRGISRALDAAHGKGILHRDLKPENVYLVFDEDGGVQAKLLDFGLVKLLADSGDSGSGSGGGDHKTKTGTPMGTPYYMSPEQCRGKDVDRATDIYAFGALVFEVLAGQVPFNGDSPIDVLLKHMTVDPPRASEVCPAVPQQLDEPILRMLAKEASDRPASVGEALELLVVAGHAAGALTGAAALPPPSKPTDAFHAMATVPSISGHTPDTIVTDTEPVSPVGHTFLASEADIAPARRSRARFGAIAAVVVLGLLVGGAVVTTLGGRRSTSGAGLTATSAASYATNATGASSSASALATASAAASGASGATAQNEDVAIRIEGAPKDAKVLAGTRELGVVPGPFTLKAGAPVTLTIVAKGWKSREVSVTPTSNATLQVVLEKAPAVQAGKPAGKGQPISSELENFDKK